MARVLFFWALALLPLYVGADEISYEKSNVKIHRLKCESLPQPSVFIDQTFTCLVKADRCAQVDFHLPRANRRVKTMDRVMLKRSGMSGNENKICVYEIDEQCPRDTYQIGDKCFSITEIGNECNYPSVAFVPEEDIDLKHVLEFGQTFPRAAIASTGLYADRDGWYREDKKPVSYFRWAPENFQDVNARAAVVLGRTELGTNEGYMRAVALEEQLPVLCVRDLSNEYKAPPPRPPPTTTIATTTPTTTKRPTTTKKRRTTTTTKRTTTTTRPTTTTTRRRTTTTTRRTTTTTRRTTTTMSVHNKNALARRLIVTHSRDYGHILMRSLRDWVHRYYVDYNQWIGERAQGWLLEDQSYGNVAYIVNEHIYNQLRYHCPELKKFYIYHNKRTAETWTLQHTSNDRNHVYRGHFYCAPRQGYCGADHELVNVRRKHVTHNWDLFIPSSKLELDSVNNIWKGFGVWHTHVNQRLCWAWRINQRTIFYNTYR